MDTKVPMAFLMLNLLLFGAGAGPGRAEDSVPKEAPPTISAEDMEIIRQMGLLENLDVLSDEDVAFLSQYEESQALPDEEVNHD